MEYERKGVTIIWQIENTKYIGRQEIELYSPVITVDVMEGTKWKLGLHGIHDSTVSLTVNREADDNDPEIFELDYEFSVNPFQRALYNRKAVSSGKFRKRQKSKEVAVHENDTYDRRTHLNPCTITIRCTIYRQKGSISKSINIFVRTLMKTQRRIFVVEIQNFNGLDFMERKTLKILRSSLEKKLMAIHLVLFPHDSGNINIILQLKDMNTELFFNFKLFILDSSGNKTDIGKYEDDISLKSVVKIPLPGVSQQDLLEMATKYLPNGTLSLHCEITFSFKIDYEKVERTELKADIVSEVEQTDFSKAVEFEMSKRSIHCDTNLQTATESFPANTTILSARSPVFEAMFKADMKETIQKCVHIDDVDAVTVKHMLMFLYSDSLEELEWKDAVKLYFAADKYQVDSLKSRCRRFLDESIDLSNCCVLLFLAYTHQDIFLKGVVQHYIIKYYKQVLHCDQWRDLEKNHPQLTIEAFRDLFQKSMEVRDSRRNVQLNRSRVHVYWEPTSSACAAGGRSSFEF